MLNKIDQSLIKRPKTIFFRNDDVWDSDSKFKKFIGIFLWYKIPLHLAVIPAKITLKCTGFLKQCIRKYPTLIEIGQHGLNHSNHSEAIKNKYEFGARRTYLQQKKDILRGMSLIKGLVSSPLIFTPPWHGYDRNTLRILSESGFHGIALDRKSKSLTSFRDMKRIKTGVYLNKKSLKGWYLEKTEVLIAEINAVNESHVGILIHHEKIKNEVEFDELRRFLMVLRGLSQVKFCRLSEV